MSKNAAELKCPRCGAVLDASVANGICPACLLKQAAMGTGTDSFPAMPWTPPSVAELASAFPQLKVLELIGHGGMGAVYKARQKSLGRLVALKILAPQHAANPDFAERFEREAKALAEVSHPNIVTVYDFGRAGEFYFLTMEFVDGVNLRQAMTAGRLTPSQALAIVPPICEALQFAHDRGIVHRDIKPENLLLDKDGRIKIADFGIARMLRGGDTQHSLGNDETASKTTGENRAKESDLTQESVLGTPSYMAPEQRDRPASVDHRADIFSLGVVLYEMLTGELPGSKLLPPSRKVEIDVRLDEIVLRALEKQPELRFQSASDFCTQVTTFVSRGGHGPRSKEDSIQSPAILNVNSAAFLVFLTTFCGFSLGLSNARGLRSNEEVAIFVSVITLLGFVWGCVMSRVMSRGNRRSAPMSQPGRTAEPDLTGVGKAKFTNERQRIAIGGAVSLFGISVLTDLGRWLVYGLPIRNAAWLTFDQTGFALAVCLLIATAIGSIGASLWLLRMSERRVDPTDGTNLRWLFKAAAVVGFLYAIYAICFAACFMFGPLFDYDRSGISAIWVKPIWMGTCTLALASFVFWKGWSRNRSTTPFDAHPCGNQLPQSPFKLIDDTDPFDRQMHARKILLAIVIAVLLVPGFYFFFNASIRNPSVAFVVAIPFLIHASVLSWRRVRTSHIVLAWLSAGMYLAYGYWEQHVKLFYPDSNIRIDLLPFFMILYTVTLTSICGMLFPQRFNSRGAARALEDAPGRRSNRSIVALKGVAVVSLAVGFVVAAELTRIRNTQEAIEVTISHMEVANGFLTIDYSAQNILGWHVWLTLENGPLISSDSPYLPDRGPIVVSRYQAKLIGSGRVQVPLEYLPTTEEGRAKILSSISTTEGHTLTVTPVTVTPLLGPGVLNYVTESNMQVWVFLTMLPEGQSPDSLPTNQAAGSPRFTTIVPTIQPKPQAPSVADNSSNSERIDSQPIIMQLDENEKFVRGLRVKTETKIRQRVGEDFGLPEIEREIKTSFAIDERGRIRSEQTGGVPGQIGTTEVRQQHEVAVYDGLLLRLLKGNANEPANWGYHGRDKYRMPREVDPRNYLLEYNNEPLRQQVSGGKYEVIAKEPFQGREVFALQTATTMRESDKTSYRGRILLDPALGYAAVYRVSQIRFDDLGSGWHDFVRSELTDYRKTTGGIWVPGQATYISFLVNRDVVKAKLPIERRLQQEIRFLDWELNPEFTDDDFTLTFPDGIFVMDESKTPESANP